MRATLLLGLDIVRAAWARLHPELARVAETHDVVHEALRNIGSSLDKLDKAIRKL